MSWGCHASKHVPKHVLKSDILWISLRHQKLFLMWGTLYGNIGSERLVKGQQKVGKSRPTGWQIVVRKMLVNIVQMLVQHRPNVG